VEEDYEWVTANLMKIANSTCDGRVVSALEGGYQLGGEFCSSFAKSVKSHVSTLCSPGLASSAAVRYDPLEAEREKQEERQVRHQPTAHHADPPQAIDAIREKREQKRIEAERKVLEWRALKVQQQEEALAQAALRADTDSLPTEVLAMVGEAAAESEDVGEGANGSRTKRRRTSKVTVVCSPRSHLLPSSLRWIMWH
jgi:hypothetical protein